jgi:FkbM family methyltransferase
MKKETILLKNIGKNKLYINSFHELPNYLKLFPFYDRALPRISKELKEIDKKLEVIDVGANIGDTVSLISEQTSGDFLCIEGDKKYLKLLNKNIKQITNANIEIEESFCGEILSTDLYLENEQGTARLVTKVKSNKIKIKNIKSLDKIILDHPKFKKANLLKIDTDGYEISVLRSGKGFISQVKPLIFLEFTPRAYNDLNQNYKELLAILINYGYSDVLFYDNYGVPVQIDKLNNFHNIEKLISNIDDSKIYYYDILVINKENKNKYKKIFNTELFKHIQKSNILYNKISDKLKNQETIINNKNKIVATKDQEIATKDQEIATKEKIISDLKKIKTELNKLKSNFKLTQTKLNQTQSDLRITKKKLKSIHNSQGWKLLLKFYKLRDKVLVLFDKIKKLFLNKI